MGERESILVRKRLNILVFSLRFLQLMHKGTIGSDALIQKYTITRVES